MFTTLVRWELRSLRRDPAAWAALLLAFFALAFALANGVRWQRHLAGLGHSVAQVETETRAHARTLAARLDRAPDPLVAPLYDPRNAYGYAYFQMQHAIALPPAPLAVLGVGQTDVLANVIPLTPGPAPALHGTAEPENPHRQAAGRFDAAFVVVYLLPLLIIGLTHGLLATERERGTLPLLLAQPITLGGLVVGRLAPRLLAVAGLIAVLAFGAALLGPPLDSSTTTRLLLWSGVGLAYAAFWFALTLRVIAQPRGAAHHALVLAGWWLALVVMAPAAVNLAVKSLAPVPSRVELILALRAAGDDALAERSRLLAAYYEDHPEFAPKDPPTGTPVDFSHVRIVTYRKLERDLEPVLARFAAHLTAQQSLVGKLASMAIFSWMFGNLFARVRIVLFRIEAVR